MPAWMRTLTLLAGGLLGLAQQPFSLSLVQVTSDHSSTPVLYAVSNAVYRSSDWGATWTPVYVLEAGLPQPEVKELVVDPSHPPTLYLATTLASGGVWKSSDGGASWRRANSGLPTGTAEVARLFATPLPAALYAQVGNQVYKSTDGAASWKLQSTLPAGGRLVVAPSQPATMFFARMLSIYRSRDEGASWQFMAELRPTSECDSIGAVGVDAQDPSMAYALRCGCTVSIIQDGVFYRPNGFYRSTNSGEMWVQTETGCPVRITVDLPGRPNVYTISSVSGGIHKSSNRGVGWKFVPLFPDAPPMSIHRPWVLPSNPDRVYAPTSMGLFQSRDAGESWERVAGTYRPTLAKTAERLDFRLQAGATSTVPLSVRLYESSAQPVDFTVTTSGEPWLSVTPAAGKTPATVTVTVRASGLATGSYTASVRIASPATANSEVSIPVRLSVTPRPAGLPEYRISNWAGDGRYGVGGDNGPATTSMLARPAGLTLDSAGNLWIADSNSGRIRRIAPDGTITSPAGRFNVQLLGDGGKATEAGLSAPVSVAVDSDGAFYIADSSNYRIRKVDTAGIITTFVGTGQLSASNPAFGVHGLTLDAARRVVFANWLTNKVSRFDSPTAIPNLASQATLKAPYDVAYDTAGNLYVVERDGHLVRKIDSRGGATTVAGTGTKGFSGDGGKATEAMLSSPEGITVDKAGNLWIADTGNQRLRVVLSDGTIHTIAGTGEKGYGGDNDDSVLGKLSDPADVAVDDKGNVYIADRGNNRIRRLEPLASDAPRIAAVMNAAGYQPEISPGSWFAVTGTNLAASTRTWRDDEIVAGTLPRQLDGVRILVNGLEAYVWYISPVQVNAIAPDGLPEGPVTVQVVSGTAQSGAFATTARKLSPAIFAMLPPAYAAARHHPDYTLVARPDQYPGCSNPPDCPPREAVPGGIVLLYGTGFGPVDPPVPTGRLVETPGIVTGKLRVRFGATWVDAFGGLASPGLYQVAAQVPESTPEGDVEVVAEVDGKASPPVKIPVRRPQ